MVSRAIVPRRRNQKKKQNGAPRGIPRGPRRNQGVSACMRQYIKALADPFDPEAVGACIPDGAGGRTMKYATTIRTVVHVPTASTTNNAGDTTKSGGEAIIMISPTACSDGFSVEVAKFGSAGGTHLLNTKFKDMENFDHAESSGTLATSAAWLDSDKIKAYGSPFVSSDFEHDGTGLKQRCVAWGIKVYNTTSPYLTNGAAFAYQAISGVGLDPEDTPMNLQNRPTTRRCTSYQMLEKPLRMNAANEDWKMVSDFQHSTDYQSIGGQYTGGSVGTTGTPPVSGALKKATAFIYLPKQGEYASSYQIEFIAHWEVRGGNAQALGTVNHNPEPATSERVYNAMVAANRASTTTIPSVTSTIQNLTSVASAVVTAVRTVAPLFA